MLFTRKSVLPRNPLRGETPSNTSGRCCKKKGYREQKLEGKHVPYIAMSIWEIPTAHVFLSSGKKAGRVFFPRLKETGPNFARCWAFVRMPSCSLADSGKRLENPWNEEAEDAWRTWSHEACDGVNGSMLAVIL